MTISDLVTDDVLARAFAWLCRRRRHFPTDADVWDFRRHWPEERARICAELRAGTYRFGLLARVTLKTGEDVEIWSPRDALVLKCCALAPHLGISPRCLHLRGGGGTKRALLTDHISESNADPISRLARGVQAVFRLDGRRSVFPRGSHAIAPRSGRQVDTGGATLQKRWGYTGRRSASHRGDRWVRASWTSPKCRSNWGTHHESFQRRRCDRGRRDPAGLVDVEY